MHICDVNSNFNVILITVNFFLLVLQMCMFLRG